MNEDTTPTEQDETEVHGWLLTSTELDMTREKIAKINKRADRRGFTGRIDVTAERTERTYTDEATGLKVTEVLYRTTVTGEAPCYNGWTFLATLDWDEHAGLIVRSVPGADPADRDSIQEGWCDHCQSRRHRKATYLVRNVETGEQKQVGSTCIQDFTGWAGKPVLLEFKSVRDEIDGMGFGGGPRSYSVETVLAAAWAVIKHDGGFRPTTSYDGSTRDAVANLLDPPRNWNAQEAARAFRPFIEEAHGMASKIRQWILSDEFSGTSDYVLNLKAVAGADEVNMRNFGLLVSAPQAWAKAQERSLIKQREKAEIRDEHYGQPGDKVTDRPTAWEQVPCTCRKYDGPPPWDRIDWSSVKLPSTSPETTEAEK